MAQFDLNEEVLIAATADQIARRLISEASFVQRLANASVSSLLSLQQLRDSYEEGVKKAVAAKVAEASRLVDQFIDSGRLRRAVADAEKEADQRLQSAAREIIDAGKLRMQRTLRQAIADLLKDRVDVLVARLMEPK